MSEDSHNAATGGAPNTPNAATGGAPNSQSPEHATGNNAGEPAQDNQNFNLGYQKAKEKYGSKFSDLEKALQEKDAKLQSYLDKEKSTEDVIKDLTLAREDVKQRDAKISHLTDMINTHVESQVSELSEPVRALLEKAAGDDVLKKYELLPEFQKMSASNKSPSQGNAVPPGNPDIDAKAIEEAIAKGDSRPLQEAIKKHGKEAVEKELYAKYSNLS